MLQDSLDNGFQSENLEKGVNLGILVPAKPSLFTDIRAATTEYQAKHSCKRQHSCCKSYKSAKRRWLCASRPSLLDGWILIALSRHCRIVVSFGSFGIDTTPAMTISRARGRHLGLAILVTARTFRYDTMTQTRDDKVHHRNW